jgi:hypothetical protein
MEVDFVSTIDLSFKMGAQRADHFEGCGPFLEPKESHE